MKYLKPEYTNEAIESNDVILASGTGLNGGATLLQTSETTAQVGASVLDILGLR